MATMTNQGAVRMQSSAANPAARSASRYAIVPGSAPADMRRARCQAIIPSAISVFSNTINDKYVTLENEGIDKSGRISRHSMPTTMEHATWRRRVATRAMDLSLLTLGLPSATSRDERCARIRCDLRYDCDYGWGFVMAAFFIAIGAYVACLNRHATLAPARS